MTPDKQKKIDKFNSIAIIVFVIALMLFLLHLVLPKVWDINTTGIYKVVQNICLTIFLVAFVCTILSGIWATDEEKKRIKEAVREELEDNEKNAKKKQDRLPVDCPLTDKALPYKDKIEDFLKRRISEHPNDTKRFKASSAQYYLVALQELHYLKSEENVDTLRRWVEQVTGKYEPESEYAHFRQGFDEQRERVKNKRNKPVNKAKQEIEKLLAEV